MADPSARQLRHRLDIEHREHIGGDYDGIPDCWAIKCRVWAAVRPMSGTELIEAQQVNAKATHKVRTPWQPGITTDMRCRLAGRTLNIVRSSNVEERNIWLELICEEVGNASTE